MKRKTLTTAIVAGLTGVAGMVSVANAVNLNPDGLGQVLIYPYYSARGGNDTLISLVNTTSAAKSVKVRFLEGLNSREVLDFNLYLSPFDVWTAAVTEIEEGVPGLVTTDSSCTVPYFFGEGDGVGVQDFLPFGFQGLVDDDGPQELERVASGYLEVIEMGTLVDSEIAIPTGEDDEDGAEILFTPNSATAVTHDETGMPADCQQLVDAWSFSFQPGVGPSVDPAVNYFSALGGSVDHEAPTGGLFGGASLINVPEGTMFSYNATALANFATTINHSAPGSLNPDLNNGVSVSNVLLEGVGAGPAVDTQTWGQPVEAVSAVLTREAILNEFVVAGGAGARSEWVVTFPTKRFYVDEPFALGTFGESAPVAPFTTAWGAEFEERLDEDGEPVLDDEGEVIEDPIRSTARACEDVSRQFWNREEGPIDPDAPIFQIPPRVSPPPLFPGPPPTTPPGFQLCFEANVVRFAPPEEEENPDVAEITKEPRFTTLLTNLNSGWARFDFDNESRPTEDGLTAYFGLPAVGFWVNTFTNGTLVDDDGNAVLANYGGTFDHRGTRTIGTPTPDEEGGG